MENFQLKRDGNFSPLYHGSWSGVTVEKEITFAGGTTNAIGDHDGTGDPFDIFTVTGVVLARLVAHCPATALTGASATLEIGTAKDTAELIAQTTATNIIANEIWHDNAPDSSVELSSIAGEYILAQDIIGTVGTANITAGVLDFYCTWIPLSSDGNVVAA